MIANLCFTSWIFAQNSNKENSPYSRYGLGEERYGYNAALKAMGGLSIAYSNPFAINTNNPASYAAIKLTTYEVGVEARKRAIASNTESYNTGTLTLSHLALAFPVGKHGGFVMGLTPKSATYYRFIDSVTIPGVGNSNKTINGDGGLTYAFMGGAYQYKQLSLGANLGYEFGTIRHSSYLANYDTFKVYSSDFTRSYQIGGLHLKLGALYNYKINKQYTLHLGATYEAAQKLHYSEEQYASSFRYSGSSAIRDTVYSLKNSDLPIQLPSSLGIGLQLISNDKLGFGVDYLHSNFNQYKFNGQADTNVNATATRITVGAYYTPDANDVYHYAQRITYRIGIYAGKEPLRINNTDITYTAFTFGASLPFKKSTDRIQTAVEIGARGTKSNNLLKENFVRFSISMSLNDRWFVKRKYD
ncbi:MAG: hypothetical protein KGN97_05270 [Bacteroidota bacterium]|nr:hypothetical protein [Bacteroidota bacterium]